MNKSFVNYILLRACRTRDIYLTAKKQIVEFDYQFEGQYAIPRFFADDRGRPVAVKEAASRSRGKFLRNGRIFTSREHAEKYLVKYLRHS